MRYGKGNPLLKKKGKKAPAEDKKGGFVPFGKKKKY